MGLGRAGSLCRHKGTSKLSSFARPSLSQIAVWKLEGWVTESGKEGELCRNTNSEAKVGSSLSLIFLTRSFSSCSCLFFLPRRIIYSFDIPIISIRQPVNSRFLSDGNSSTVVLKADALEACSSRLGLFFRMTAEYERTILQEYYETMHHLTKFYPWQIDKPFTLKWNANDTWLTLRGTDPMW